MTRRRAFIMGLVSFLAASCAMCRRDPDPSTSPADGDEDDGPFARQRGAMVKEQLAARDIANPRVLDAMGRVPRHRFVPAKLADSAYQDGPLPIGYGQTISQPYIVALMTQLADPQPGDRVLDIGTGSGYQAAVLAEMGANVTSIEIVPELAEEARARLRELKYDKVEVLTGDGYRGHPPRAPFRAILLAAAAPKVPQPLLDQLAPGGRLVLPVGDGFGQDLLVITKQPDGTLRRETVAPVMFVPMTGEVRDRGDTRR
jgi:protein-L-isoaspartate(D-aspartate) O-methyltransferase